MVNTKNRSTPVVEKREDKKCDCGCGCDNCTCGCKCGSGDVGKTLLLCGTILVSAFLVAGAVFLKPYNSPKFRRPLPSIAKQDSVVDEAAIRTFIQKNPKLLIETVEKYYAEEEAKAAKAAPVQKEPFNLDKFPMADEALVKQIVADKTNYSLGNENGKFVIIEFFDYQCGWCKRTNKGLEEAVAKAEGKNIRWIPIDTPIFGEASETIARYVLAAGEQGKYAEMHQAVGAATGRLDEAALLELGKGLKLDTQKLKAAANGDKIKKKLESNNEFREKLNISGVPMLIVDGHKKPGALLDDDLDVVVKLSAEKK